MKYTALANVKKMRDLLDSSIDVIGVGGVETGADAFEMILCGAAAVQVGTKHWIEGAGCFDRIAKELGEIMDGKGYKSIEEFRGKLKPWSKEGASVSRKMKKAAGGGGATGTKAAEGGGDISTGMMLVNAFLIAIVAALVADKLGYLKI